MSGTMHEGMTMRKGWPIIILCLLSCLPASARIEGRFLLDQAVQEATHVVVLEAGGDGFHVVESWAGDLAAGTVLDCLDLYPVDSAQYARVADEEPPDRGAPAPEGAHPVLVDELVFVPEGAKIILFLREIREGAGYAVPTVELLPERQRRFACVWPVSPCIVSSLVWCVDEGVFQFFSMFSGGPGRPEPINSQVKGWGGKNRPMKLDGLKELVTSRQGKGEPAAERGLGAAEEVERRTLAKRLMKACQFRDVVLRLFRTGEVAGTDYEAATGQILGTRISPPTGSVPETGVFVCVPDDQTDAVVAEGLSNHVQLWTSKGEARLNPWDFSPESQKAAQVLDALGKPLPGARVSLAMQKGYRDSATEPVPLCERVTDENGRVNLLALPAGRDGVPEWHYPPLEIAHTEYGLTQVRWHGDSFNGDRTLRTALLREGSEARDRALRGVVVGPDTKPVSGAIVTSESIRPPGLLINGYGTAVTDEQGRFCLYLPELYWAGHPEKSTELVPLRSKYSYHVTPPEGAGLRPAGGWALNSEPVTITLESEDAFAARGSVHTFAFEGGFPESTGPQAGIQVAVRSDDAGFGVDLLAPDEEHQLPHGTYYARIASGKAGSGTRHFKPLVVNSESPKELAFSMIHARCAGRVINGVTGEPVPGALCLVGARSWIPLCLSFDDLPEALRKALGEPGASESNVERLAGPLGNEFPLLKAVVTDEDGRYEVAAPSGSGIQLVFAIAEDFVPAARHVYSGNPSSKNQFDIDAIPLYPAGKACVKVSGDGAKGRCRATWHADEAATADWAVPLKGYDDRSRYSLEIMTGRFEGGQPDAMFLVPANAPLHMTIHPPDAGLIPVRMVETVRVGPGQVVDLGEVRFAKAFSIPAAVHVVDDQGNPVEGVPIRTFSGNCWSLPCLTDKEGLAQFDVSPGVTEKVGVSSVGLDMSFPVSPDLEGSAQIEHTFKVRAEQLKKLLERHGGL
jgi:hypothetical protein